MLAVAGAGLAAALLPPLGLLSLFAFSVFVSVAGFFSAGAPSVAGALLFVA
ncbi:MAG: hypothetical protein WBC92_15015 [Terracidiphilus sp.]